MPKKPDNQPLNLSEAGSTLSVREIFFSGDFSNLSEDYDAFLNDDLTAFSLWFGALETYFSLEGNVSKETLKALLRSAIEKDLLALKTLLDEQIDRILHAEKYQKLEGRWRGLASLVVKQFRSAQRVSKVIVRFFPASWKEISKDLSRSVDFDDSKLFQLWYENEFGHPGGQPFGLMLIDHEISYHPRDIEDLKHVSNIAAVSFIPVVLSASPSLFGADSFTNLANSHHISSVFEDRVYHHWRKFQYTENARFVGLVLPYVRARSRWTYDNNLMGHSEKISSLEDYCWSPGIYEFGRNVIRACQRFGWPADIRGIVPGHEGGAFIQKKATDTFRFGSYTFLPQAPVALGFTDEQERDITSSGFMLINTLVDGHIAFVSTCSVQLPEVSTKQSKMAEAHRRINRDFGPLLCACRFAHYIKMLGRDMVGRFTNADEISQELRRWLSQYTSVNASSSLDGRARYPLLSSDVSLEPSEDAEKYHCLIKIEPHYQLENAVATFHFKTMLSKRSK
ncbi:type VI secretion system contractile sheath large subunit [Acetobacteraceae bacterium]|nr:type VI secretion system contractile sheath large subunit [Acetobacteraceae bacterium]